MNKHWYYDDTGKPPYNGVEVPNSQYNDPRGFNERIPWHIQKPQGAYYDKDLRHWKVRRHINRTRAETEDQHQPIFVKNNVWYFVNAPNTPVVAGTEPTAEEEEPQTPAEETAPPQGPPPPPSRPISPAASDMSNNDVKINPPKEFDGNRDDTLEFLTDCENFINTLGTAKFDTDTKKIAWTLSYLKGGSAGPWKISFIEGHPTGYGTWTEFKNKFKEVFGTIDHEAKNRLALMNLRQGNTSADDHIVKFRTLIARSGINDNVSQTTLFQTSLNDALRAKIYSHDPLPTTIEEWYNKASTLDHQWQFANSMKSGSSFRSSRPTRDTKVRAVNLNFAERQKYIKEGRCFRCDKIGHRANNPQFHPRNEARPFNQGGPRPNTFQRGLGQQIRQTTAAQPQEEEPPQEGTAIQELLRKIQNMNTEDQDTVLEMFSDMENPQGF